MSGPRTETPRGPRVRRVDRVIARVTVAIVGLLLRAYPRAFRDEFGAETRRDVARHLDEAAGTRQKLGRAVTELASAARDLVREWSPRRQRRSSGRWWRPDSILADLRHARRRVFATPLASLIVVGTFALAIGAATAIFSVADAVLLRPLPFPDSHQLVRLTEETATPTHDSISVPAFRIWQRELPSLAAVAAYEPGNSLVIVKGEPEQMPGAGATRAFFSVLGTPPHLGHVFTPADDFGAPDEVVLSHTLWQRLGGTTDIVGGALEIEQRPYRIVGVMPPGFSYPDGALYWSTVRDMGVIMEERTLRFLDAIARLAPEATLSRLRAELEVLTARYPSSDSQGGDTRMTAVSLHDAAVGSVRTGIVSAGSAVIVLIVIACCNIAALMLARASARRREHAVQRALGAGSGRLMRQQLLEVAVLAIPGAALGILAAALCRDAIVALSLDEIPRIAGVAIDGRVVVFATAVTVAAALVATILPSWLASRAQAALALGSDGRSRGQSRPVIRLLRGLVVAQVALTVVLIATGVLLARTLMNLASTDLGFAPDRVTAVRLHLPLRLFTAGKHSEQLFYESVLERTRAVPGVEAAGLASRRPLSDAPASVEVSREDSASAPVRAAITSASAGFLATIGASLDAGSDFGAGIDAVTPAVLVNDRLARRLFPAGDALGKQVHFRYFGRPVRGVVHGVIRTVRLNGLAGAPPPELIVDYRYRPLIMDVFVRTTRAPHDVLAAIRTIVRDVDPTRRVTIDQLSTLDSDIARHLARPRFFLVLVGGFGLAALILAASGLYGVLTFAVQARRHDLGVRLAVGATPAQIVRGTIAGGLALAALGVGLGLGAAAVVTQFVATLLHGVAPRDPATFVVTAGVALAVAAAACWLPARLAGRLDPLIVLRTD